MMSFVAWPRAAAYVAARWALRGFTEALRQDLRGTTIKVTLIAAGAVKSPYWQHNQSLDRMPKGNLLLPLLLPEQVAEAIVRSVEKDQQLALLPWGTKLIFAMQRVAPRLVSWLMAKAAAA
jgi:short-subunit dehydrogenase